MSSATVLAASQQVLAVQSSVQSITSRLLRSSPSTATTTPPTGVAATLAGVSALHRLNVESLAVLKEKLQAANPNNSSAAAASANNATAAVTSAENLPSLTWLTFMKTLPPSGNASNPDVTSLKTLFGQLIATVAEICDDDRDGEALAISAAVVYKALRTRVRKEKEAKASAAAAAATTSTGADAAPTAVANVPASPELLATLKSIAAAAKTEIVRACGRAPESMIVRLLNILGEMERIQADMQSKYEQLRLLRELKQLSTTANTENDGIKIISAPKDASLPSLPLLDREFGSELPIMYEEDSPDLASSDLASKPVMALIEQIKQSLRISQQPPATAATVSTPLASLLSLSPTPSSASSSSNYEYSDFDLSEEEELYVGESDEDEIEREHQRLVDLNNQQVRALSLEKKDRASVAKASSTEPLELPSNPLGWWNWLMGQCDRLVTYNEAGLPVLTANEIATQVLHILQSSRPDVQNDLLETLGFEGIELCETLIKYRKEIKTITVQHQAQARQTKEQRAAAEAAQTQRGKDGSVVRGLIGISIHSQAELDAAKARKRADRRHMRRSAAAQAEADRYTIDEEKLEAQASLLKPLISSSATQMSQQLPAGTTRQLFKGYEEVHIPALKKVEVDESQLLQIEKNFEPFAQQAFPRMKTLNRIQSKVYQSAYHSNSNMLVCAPTGAGKTNIAMMCVLREIQQHIVNGVLQKDMFKIVYVAPMKALAQEVQEAFQRRLAPLGVLVKELTGDMQLTKKELKETQMLIVTPEKYDVVSRKSGEANLMSLVKLLIIDEVHLLNEDRGPVLEILVARTLRMVETSQQMCRIVGLSATLPNHQDVAVFLKCGPGGVFHFDASYRPVPLAQTFIGVTEKNSMLRLQSMNEITFKKVVEAVKLGRQVMVFVHSRRDTVKTARFLRDMAQKENASAFFDSSKDEQYAGFEKKAMRSRNSDLTELFQYGFSMHNAGMVRSDRSLVEAAFGAGVIKVLCCTATLAWGVNLPAHTCIIKGTQIYNAEKGGFMDIGILDIQQIFGRAGRPQFIGDDFGEAMMICEHDKLQHYLSLLTHQLPIESQFIKELPNHLNAEIILGTVTNLHEAVEWLSYTYLYTRMLRNPMVYGISFDEMQFDELLINHRTTLIIEAAKTLMRCRMIKFDQKSGQFYSTDVGRVAAHYYLHFESIELYNDMLKPIMTDEEILHLLASSKEFTQIKVRDEEINEIDKLKKKFVPINIKGGFESNTGKQNLLLQCYISNAVIDTPTLISDSYFIQQSAGRICRALFEMVLKRGKAFLASKFLTYAKCIELKIWEFQSPLRQFLSSRDLSNQGGNNVGAGHSSQGGLLKMPTIMKLEEKNLKVDQLIDMEANEISGILKHNSLGHTVKQALSYIPYLSVEATIQPITRSVLKIDMELRAEFVWNDRQHGNVESFWIWIEDTNNEHIYHSEHFLLHKKEMNEVHKLTFTIPIFEPLPPQYYIRVVSDRWLGSDNVVALNFKHLILPELYPANTALLDLHPLPRSALMNAAYEKMYEKKFQYFNPIQTQIFHTLYHTDENILLGAPTGSGKTIVAELAILRLFSMFPGQKVVYIAPLKALARERIEDWNSAKSFKGMLNKKIVELTGDTAPDQAAILAADIIITTPEKFDGTSRGWKSRAWVQKIALVIVDEIHLLGADRGPVLEVIVSRMRFISSHTSSPIRIVGLSTALSNAKDLADWLGIEKAGLFNFPPSVRPVPLTIHIAGYAGQHFCPRMATMNKPTYAAIQTHSPAKPSLVFVASRRQTRLTALDLIAFSAADGDPRKWLHMSEAELQKVLKQVSDPTLRHMISFGIGMHHAGLQSRDRQIVEKLFLDFKIQVLVCTSTLAWGVNFPCHLVVVKGTEFYDAKVKRYVDMPITDVLQMIGRAGRPQFDVDAKAVVLVHEPKKNYYLNFLHSPFPVESSLLSHLHDHINAEICGSGTIKSVPDLLDYLSWTFFFRRLLLNPSYYGLEDVSSESLNRYLMELVVRVLGDLERAGLIMQEDETRKIVPLTLGKIASFYYLKYTTMMVFSDMLRPDANVENLLQVLSYVKEYEELPVRHNEDKFNAELNSSMKWPVDTASFDSPFVKAHMLFQAHFSRLELPISDYYLDLKSMLDQSIRILQAMVDTTAEAGWLATSLNVMNLMQMVVQGRWKDDSTLLNLPGFEQHEKLAHTLRGEKLDSLLRVAQADKSKLASICKKSGMNEKETEEFVEAASRMPVIQMNLARVSEAASSSAAPADKSEPAKRKAAATTPIQPHTPLSVPARSTVNLQVSLHRTNSNPNVRILTPVFSKPKDEGWWLVVGMAPGSKKRHGHGNDASGQHLLAEPQDELVTMKRVNNLKNRQTINVKIQVPDFVGPHSYTVYLVSDSYLGLDQTKHFEIHTTANGNARSAGDDDDIYS